MVYDPFVDYGEFGEDDEQEKRDMDFFLQGRFLSLSIQAMQRQFTGTMRPYYQNSFSFGFFFSYFFSMNHALQMGYSVGQHSVYIPNDISHFRSSLELNQLSFNYYYYFNPERLVQSLAQFKPHLILGFSSWQRKFLLSTSKNIFSGDSASSLNFGLGIEMFFNKSKMFISLQTLYHFIQFSEENKTLFIDDEDGTSVDTGIVLKGDMIDFIAGIGLNF